MKTNLKKIATSAAASAVILSSQVTSVYAIDEEAAKQLIDSQFGPIIRLLQYASLGIGTISFIIFLLSYLMKKPDERSLTGLAGGSAVVLGVCLLIGISSLIIDIVM